jgi:CelD/BcsL family acetyltransferase involved in cellulose biosynthesis
MIPMRLVEPRRLVVSRRPLADEGWRAFAAGRADVLPFHDNAWVDVLTDAYGFRSFVAVAADSRGKVAAGVPVVEVRRPFGARRWLALPFTDYCPLLADGPEAAQVLVAGLEELRSGSGVSSLEFRSDVTPDSYPVGVRHVLALDPDPEVIFGGFKKKQVRQVLTKALRERIVGTRISHERADFEAFLRLHVATRRRLGVPVQPPAFFERLWQRFIVQRRGFVVVAEAGETPVSAAVFLTGDTSVIYKFSASDSAAWQLRPNNLVLWTAIEHACREGYASFDFGRTETAHEGLRLFKSGWGAEELPLRYSVLGREAPVTANHQSGGSVAASIIRNSPPVVCRLAGRALYRYAA